MQLAITEYASTNDNAGTVRQYTWSAFAERLSKPFLDKAVTVAQYQELQQQSEQVDEKGNATAESKTAKNHLAHLKAKAGAFVTGEFDGTRTNKNLRYRNTLNLDADEATSDFPSEIAKVLEGKAYAIYSTRSDSQAKRKFRVIIPISERIDGDQFKLLTQAVISKNTLEGVDPASLKPAQMMYYPTISKDQEYYFHWQDGDFLSPADYQDEIEKLQAEQVRKAPPTAPRLPVSNYGAGTIAGDPRTRKDIVGAFCRAYSIDTAIQQFLASVYEYEGTHDKGLRYRHKNSASKGGLLTYSDNQKAYSHHGMTDQAANATEWDAFNLVCLHNFNNDFRRCKEWASTLPLVQIEIKREELNLSHIHINERLDQHLNNITTATDPTTLEPTLIYNSDILTDKENIAPIFIVEGEANAKAIEQAGGRAIGIDYVSNNIIPMLVDLKQADKLTTAPLLLAMDNTSEGMRKNQDLDLQLQTVNEKTNGEPIKYLTVKPASLYGYNQNASTVLTASEKFFSSNVSTITQKTDFHELRKYLYIRENTNQKYRYEYIFNQFIFNNEKRISTGISDQFDKMLGGGLKEGVFYIGASPGAGKTTLIVQMMNNLARQGYFCFYYSLEIGEKELLDRTIASISYELSENKDHALTMQELKDFSILSQEKKNAFASVKEEVYKCDDKIVTRAIIGACSTDDIKKDLDLHFDIYGLTKGNELKGDKAYLPIVFIDFLQLLSLTSDTRSDIRTRIDNLAKELKQISWEYHIPIVALSSISRADYDKPSLSSFKESGGIESSGDVAITMEEIRLTNKKGNDYQLDNLGDITNEPRVIKVKSHKSRVGVQGGFIHLELKPQYAFFSDLSEDLEYKLKEFFRSKTQKEITDAGNPYKKPHPKGAVLKKR